VLTKFVPFTVNVKAELPAVLVAGEIVVTVGTGLLTTRLVGLERPPPGVGLETVIGNVPAAAMSANVSCAVNWLGLTNVVVRLLPLKRTTEVLTKFVPFTVKTKAASPAVALAGRMFVVVGTRLLTVRVAAVEVPPDGVGLKTVIDNKAPA